MHNITLVYQNYLWITFIIISRVRSHGSEIYHNKILLHLSRYHISRISIY